MKTGVILSAALIGVATALAQEMIKDISHNFGKLERALTMRQDTTQQWNFENFQDQTQQEDLEIPSSTFDPVWIDHDQVKPFAQPEAVIISEKAGIKFKPQLHISTGCYAYPAVNEAGETSNGLEITGSPSSGCKGSGWASQVYGRADWFRGIWGIMYAWYFPKDPPLAYLGHRHDWEHVIVWIDNPAVQNTKIFAVTPSVHDEYLKNVPPDAGTVNGTSVKSTMKATGR